MANRFSPERVAARLTHRRASDLARYRTVEVFDVHSQTWTENARRVTPRTAETLKANLESFNHVVRIVPNIYVRGVFGPTLPEGEV
jgi:hypothetical protein